MSSSLNVGPRAQILSKIVPCLSLSTLVSLGILPLTDNSVPADHGTKGPYACVGKRLALLEIRRVVAEVLSRYDIKVTPEHNKEGFLDGKQDTFTLVSADLPLIFTPRL